MHDVRTVLLLIVLQQGLCALSWWVGGWRLGLSKLVSAHWMVAALATGGGLALILQRGAWPLPLTLLLANFLIAFAFVAMRRGVQIFLRLPVTDREHGALLAGAALLLLGAIATGNPVAAVFGASVPLAWTLLRSARESYAVLRRQGALAPAHVVAAPLTALGVLFTLRALAAVVAPDVAARPLNEATAFNATIVLVFMLVGLMTNLVLALMVVGQLIGRLQHLSERDALTGLLNRRAIAPLMLREAGRLRRYGETYALLMIDVDHFKAINDTLGHAAGDAALVQLARVLREAAREVDSIARMGGEEFCILLPHCQLEGAKRLAERVHLAVHMADWAGTAHRLTVSVGVAVALDPAEPAEAVLERADRALYRAKHDGRDRVVVAEPGSLAPA